MANNYKALQYGNLYDATKCTACRGCMVACKNWNKLPAVIEEFKGNLDTHGDTNAHTFTIIKFMEDTAANGMPVWRFVKRNCMHCDDPACMKACPRKALSKNEWGAVVKDYDKCVGCQYCATACPFEIPKLDGAKDKVTKCTMCSERVNSGLDTNLKSDLKDADNPFKYFKPACAKTCPSGALTFGKREDLMIEARKRVAYLQANGFPNATIYGEKELGGLNNLYILGDTPDKYELPVNPQVGSMVTGWQDYVKPWIGLLIPLALAGSAASFFTTRLLKAKHEKITGGETHGTSH